MRKIIVSEFVTLDGVIQAPGGVDEDTDGGFIHGGWTWPYWHDDIGEVLGEAIGKAGAMLLGRKTWVTHGEAFEPMADDDPDSVGLNVIPKFVVSTTLESADAWRNSTLITDNVLAEIQALKEQQGGDLYIDGSSVLVHSLVRNGLVDEFHLLVYPIVLGSGKKVFPDDVRLNLRLLNSRPFPTGVVLQHYAVGDPESDV